MDLFTTLRSAFPELREDFRGIGPIDLAIPDVFVDLKAGAETGRASGDEAEEKPAPDATAAKSDPPPR
jgi:hypothetical protein